MATNEPPDAPLAVRPDPLREAALSDELQELARKSLPEVPAERMEVLQPVFSFIAEIPVGTVEQAGFKFRRARIRLTMEDRGDGKQPFRIRQDFSQSPDLYWGKPIVLHGYLQELKPVNDASGSETAGYQGRLKIWNSEDTVSFVTQKPPNGIAIGTDLNQPASIVGYMFRETKEPPEPIVVAHWVRIFQTTIDPQSLASIKDRTLRIGPDEADAYYRGLLQARLVDLQAQQEAASEFWEHRQEELERPRPQFVDLFKQMTEEPEMYRGQAVTLTGTLRKMREVTVDPLNDYGVETLYEGWIFAEDSQSNPTVVVFTENSDNLPEGDDISVFVKVTGYVFKMYGYESRDPDNPLRVAPMLLAGTVQKMTVSKPGSFPVVVVGAAIALFVAGIVVFLWTSHQKDKQSRKQASRAEEDEPPRFDNLEAETD